MPPQRLALTDVVGAASAILDESGLDAVSLREIARRLGVHLNSVSFQVKSKSRLLELLADSVLGSVELENLPSHARPRVEEILRRYRAALLSRRDGARLVAGTSAVEAHTLRVGDAIVGALLESGVDAPAASHTFWSLHYFTIGLVLEEQAHHAEPPAALDEVLATGRYRSLERIAGELASADFPERFDFGIGALLDGAGVS